MDTTWRNLTEYHRCACCGEDLNGMVIEIIKGRQRLLVECNNQDCAAYGQTLSVHEHVSLCYQINDTSSIRAKV